MENSTTIRTYGERNPITKSIQQVTLSKIKKYIYFAYIICFNKIIFRRCTLFGRTVNIITPPLTRRGHPQLFDVVAVNVVLRDAINAFVITLPFVFCILIFEGKKIYI